MTLERPDAISCDASISMDFDSGAPMLVERPAACKQESEAQVVPVVGVLPPKTSVREAVTKFDAFFAASDADRQARLRRALDVVHRAIDIFGIEGVCFSFNGGKDSTAVLHVLRIVLAKRVLDDAFKQQQEERARSNVNASASTPTTVMSPRANFVSVDMLSEEKLETRVAELMHRMPCMYFDSHDQFPQVRDFIHSCIQQYSLNCQVYRCSFVEGIKDMQDKLNIKATFMGVRCGDPHTEDLEHFSPSTAGWPAFMRVNPILRWTFCDVWDFMLECGLSYCELYDHGYTSLGSIYDTEPNPALWVPAKNDNGGYYLPAHHLKDQRTERCGRQRRRSCSSS